MCIRDRRARRKTHPAFAHLSLSLSLSLSLFVLFSFFFFFFLLPPLFDISLSWFWSPSLNPLQRSLSLQNTTPMRFVIRVQSLHFSRPFVPLLLLIAARAKRLLSSTQIESSLRTPTTLRSEWVRRSRLLVQGWWWWVKVFFFFLIRTRKVLFFGVCLCVM